jgi:hypothetical protein
LPGQSRRQIFFYCRLTAVRFSAQRRFISCGRSSALALPVKKEGSAAGKVVPPSNPSPALTAPGCTVCASGSLSSHDTADQPALRGEPTGRNAS